MNKIVSWLGQTMEFDGKLSSAIAKHKITNFPGGYIYEDGLFKKDNVSHLGHLIGAICGCIYGFYILY